MTVNKNPYKDIFNFNDETTSLRLYDAITLRFGRVKALMMVGGEEETAIWRFNKSYIINYFSAAEALIEELSFLVEKFYEKSKFNKEAIILQEQENAVLPSIIKQVNCETE